MDRLANMQVFVSVTESGGFKATARQLGLSPAAVTRAIAALEKQLGVVLFERTTRAVHLTDAGREFLPLCRRILATVDEAEECLSDSQSEPRGELSLTAPSRFGALYCAPLVFTYLERHPHVRARTLFVDRIVDLVAEGFDIGIRIARLPDSTLTAVRVGAVRSVVCASPRYLARRGIPMSPADLAGHDAITFSPTRRPGAPWSFTPRQGARAGDFEVGSPRLRLTVNSVETAISAAVNGHGITRVLSYQISREIEEGHLVRLLEDYDTDLIPVHIVYPAGRRASAKVREFVDHAAAWLRSVDFCCPGASALHASLPPFNVERPYNA